LFGIQSLTSEKKTTLTGLGSHFTSLTLPHVCACPKPGLGFPSFVVVLYNLLIFFSPLFFSELILFPLFGIVDC
jgi:hypothetical protein